ncbi:MAG: tyrosine-type recombinase/integrase [Ilumatobacter sp.]|uniref:tyrosine-type recombinase/integrase n=1 Tax=Ilumatobacter sp. TaxID=1967498 RepID=UPI00391CE65A
MSAAVAHVVAAGEVTVGPGRPRARHIDWPEIAAVAPVLAGTMQRYLAQIAVSLRPASVRAADRMLRQFAGFVTGEFPEIVRLVDVERVHVEGFKRHLGTRLSQNDTGRTLSPTTIRITLGTLRTFFERVSEWDYPDAPKRVLIFNGDLPTPDDPLPKFLSDPDAAKLMRAAADADPVRRLVIEMLARTGLRVGEFCELTADAVVEMSGRHWLRVPIGKLHNDRYVPLHPQLVEQLDHHARSRSDDLDRLIVFNGRRLDRHIVSRMVRRVAKAAGIGHVHPHQLRHTLATQAINRGMSLEAIAAMLGHKTLRMTLVYARIADRTVADAYDRVTSEVDALYTKPNGLRSAPGGTAAMAHLAAEFDQKLLGNGHCNRPSQLDCQFESICESCAYFSTNTSFVPVLETQRDHAAERDQHHRVDLFDTLLERARTEQP